MMACVSCALVTAATSNTAPAKATSHQTGTRTTAAKLDDIKGVLMDQKCSGTADLRISGSSGLLVGGRIVAEAHTRQCALMPQCVKSGYGVYTSDNKFLTFDASGNRKALAALRATKQLDDLEVEVTGKVNGESIRVSTLKLLPPQ